MINKISESTSVRRKKSLIIILQPGSKIFYLFKHAVVNTFINGVISIDNFYSQHGLAIWLGYEYILNFLFANRL